MSTRQGLIVGEAFRKRLHEQSSADIEAFSDFLDLSRFPEAGHRQRIVGYLAEKYAQTIPDLVFAVGPEVLQLLSSNRGRLMPNVPIVVCCMLPETVAAIGRLGDVAGVASEVDLAKTLALAERLQPKARRLVIIAGASPSTGDGPGSCAHNWRNTKAASSPSTWSVLRARRS